MRARSRVSGWLLVGGSAVVLLAGVVAWPFVSQREGKVGLPAPQVAAQTPTSPESVPDAGVVEKTTVRIVFQVVPPVRAEVRYGRKRLGYINGQRRRRPRPLIIQRPRDSGPIDVVVRAEGFLRVHTRAYTFDDNKVIVKLTPEEEKSTLLGYRREIPDGGPDGGQDASAKMPDAGAPIAVPGTPPPTLIPTPSPYPAPMPAPAPIPPTSAPTTPTPYPPTQ